MKISRALFPSFENHKLATLAKNLGVAETIEHRALSDAIITAKCLNCIVSNFSTTEPKGAITYISGNQGRTTRDTSQKDECKIQLDLVNYRTPQMQEAILKCTPGNKIDFLFDNEKLKYLAISEHGEIGYFSKNQSYMLEHSVDLVITFFERRTNEKGVHIPTIEIDYYADMIAAKNRDRR